jgi:5'-nucleotidase
VNSFLAGGGDGFSVLTQGTNDVVGGPDVDALVAYLGANRPTAPPPTDRITTA